ncbi:MAG: hydroxymethylglutaryl-CoA reductase [bacterium]|nr:hydroxymethylglutaryl-CoA reductase [bacterium]
MAVFKNKLKKIIDKLNNIDIPKIEQKIKEFTDIKNSLKKLPKFSSLSNQDVDKRIEYLKEILNINIEYLNDKKKVDNFNIFQGNIENFIGTAKIPVGIVGPIKVKGLYAQGEFFVPMATTEGALVASYNRGSMITNLAGGITSICLAERVSRAPAFKFNNLIEASKFILWISQQFEKFYEISSISSRHGKLEDILINIDGNIVFISFDFHTADASGQNMVTIITENICKWIIENTPIKPISWFIESNLSGDKKASYLSYLLIRGKKVVAEALIPNKLIEKFLRTSAEKIDEYVRISTTAATQSGTMGAQGHYANALAAIFIACGQDAACVSESAIGITRTEIINKDLYISVNIPNLIVGTVGGGTSLPTQKECLEITQCYGAGNANKFAEIIGATILAGELSIVGSIAAGDFAQAHKKYRKKNT